MNLLSNTQAHNTLLQSRKDQTPGNNSNLGYHGMTNGKLPRNTSGKELVSQQKLNFTTNARADGGASKSVDKAGTSGAPPQNGTNYNINKINGTTPNG